MRWMLLAVLIGCVGEAPDMVGGQITPKMCASRTAVAGRPTVTDVTLAKGMPDECDVAAPDWVGLTVPSVADISKSSSFYTAIIVSADVTEGADGVCSYRWKVSLSQSPNVFPKRDCEWSVTYRLEAPAI